MMVESLNKTYCSAAFHHIYSESNGAYKLCCHSYSRNEIPYNSSETPPFEFFFSPEMEDIRERMIMGEEIDQCQKCYNIEKNGYLSYRQTRFNKKYVIDEVKDVELKLRIFGNHCNLSCYMCHPFNSSTRAKELKEIGIYDEISMDNHYGVEINPLKWKIIQDDIINNISLVKEIHITGGEPFLLPKHYKFLDAIPEKYGKDITLIYDTNLTALDYKGKSIMNYCDKFKEIRLNVSCDHFKEKLEFIRYPIDYQSFEKNVETILNSRIKISIFNVTVSILNVEDLYEIKNYYLSRFGDKLKLNYNSVNFPLYLNIKNHPKKTSLLSLYENDKDMNYVCRSLKLPNSYEEWNYGLDYIKKLNDHRNTNFEDLWPDYKKIEVFASDKDILSIL